MDEPRRIVVVGAGLAGLRTVESLRQVGYAGDIVLIGGESHPPYSRPPLSKEVLRGEAPPTSTYLREETAYADLGVDMRLGRNATAIDTEAQVLTLDDDTEVAYNRCVLATGATPRQLPGVDATLDGVHVLRTIDDSVQLRDVLACKPRLVVVGAGFIGSEVASSARAIGCDVTVLEVASAPLVHALGPEMGEACATLHREHGVDLRVGTGVSAIEGSGSVERVILEDGSVVEADVVVVGVGVVPNVGWLEGSGLSLDNGVLCDEFCQTSAGQVYAVGDLARWENKLFSEAMRLEHWTNAAEQAAAVAQNLVGEPKAFSPVPYFWSDQFDTKIQVVGRPKAGDEVTVAHGDVASGKFTALYGRDSRLSGVVGFRSARHVMSYRPLLAASASYDEALAQAQS